MRIKEAIAEADALRDNTIDEETKAKWLFKVDGQVADVIGYAKPEPAEDEEAAELWPFEFTWPEDDTELLMPHPHDDIYTFYLVAMIDLYNQEPTMYQNDMQVFNNAMNEARAWWQRTHEPAGGAYWKVW